MSPPLLSLDPYRTTITLDTACTTVILVQLLCAAVSLGFVVRALGREHDPALRRALLISLVIFTVAFLVRWLAPLHTLIHENRHGYELRALPPINTAVSPHGISSAHVVLAKLVALFLPGDDAFFVMGSFFSAAAVVGMFWFARQLFSSALAGAISATLLLWHPLSVAMAPTEEFMVSATGLCLMGLPLLWWGLRRNLRSAMLLGIMFVSLAASVREIALPLAVLIPMTLLGASPPGERIRWGRIAVFTALAAALLVPRAFAIVQTARETGESLSYLGVPELPFKRAALNMAWVGWWSPYVPRWLSWAALASTLGLLAHVMLRRNWRLALAALGTLFIAYAQGGLVSSGWFPSAMRHQLFAMTLFMLPIGWAVAAFADRLGRLFPGRRRTLAWGLGGAVAAASVATFAATPEGFRVDIPMTREYQFFARTLEKLPRRAQVVLLRAPHLRHEFHLPENWFRGMRPEWRRISSERLLSRSSGRAASSPPAFQAHAELPTYVFIDRACFLNEACFVDRPAPDCKTAPPLTDRMVQTPHGRMQAHCWAVAQELGGRELAGVELQGAGPLPQPHDLPTVDPKVRIAVLVRDATGAAPAGALRVGGARATGSD